jgi:hypothetical protein
VGIRIPRPVLENDETQEFRVIANHLKGDRKIIGRLTVTDKRVIFNASRFYFLTHGNSFEIDRSSITGLQVRPPGWEAMKQHGLVALKRPQIEIRYGGKMVYVAVRHPHDVVNRLNGGGE